jgi:8-oxo-dGTP pyrophosphatase MutT (NUDIX family)
MNAQRPTPKQSIPPDATKVFSGIIFDVYQWPQKLYNGQTATFEQLRRPDSVNVIPITDEGKIILAKQEQPGMDPFIGAISGRVDRGEKPEQAAKRELLEEGGLRAEQLLLWDATQIAEKLDWTVWTFIAKRCQQTNQQLEGGEKIQLIEVTFEEYIDLVTQDNYRDSEIALKLLKLSRLEGELERVKRDWLG